MSIRLVAKTADPNDGFKAYLKTIAIDLNSCTTAEELTSWITNVREFSKSNSLNSEQKTQLTALRQKAYNKKRQCKPGELNQVSSSKETSHKQEENVMSIAVKKPVTTSDNSNPTFFEGVFAAFQKIDGEKVVSGLPKVMFSIVSTGIVLWFLWVQSASLYRSGGFENPDLAAAGALMMVLGNSAYHAIHRSKLALLGCLYISSYEVYFMASGTATDEASAAMSSQEVVQQLEWHRENITTAKSTYNSAKKRYQNPSSKVFKNAWFKKNHLEPAWRDYSEAQSQSTLYIENVAQSQNFDHLAWMKLLYRLGIVALAILLVHHCARVLASFQLKLFPS